MENTTAESKKGFLQNDRRLVCGMLVFYGLCIIGAIAGTFWGLNQRNATLSAGATSTAYMSSTQQAQGTATAAARATEQGQFEFIDNFDVPSNNWYVGEYKNNGYWDGSMEIKEGVYVWKVDKVKQNFVQRIEYFHPSQTKDFDVYLDTKFAAGTFGSVCSGLVFRRSFKGWDAGAYIFNICNDSTFRIRYHGENGWEKILDRQFNNAIRTSDWNRIEVGARGDHFILTINNVVVYVLTDLRQTEGALEIIISVTDKRAAVILFDNFGYQSH